jgi:hypothetical protein
MNREVHVPFCERLRGEFLRSTQQRSDSEVKMQALRNGVKSLRSDVSTPCWVETGEAEPALSEVERDESGPPKA